MGLNIRKEDRILIAAPHPDDESIGCGGLIALYGKQCDVLLITDGDNHQGEHDLAKIRESEFIHAMTLAGVKGYQCLRLPERQIRCTTVKKAAIDFRQYSHVFVPNRYDAHEDHAAVYKVIKKLVPKSIKLYEYEVWSPLRNPNVYLDISDVSEKKRELIECHRSQTAALDYPGMILGLNAYRGRSHGYPFAECYYCEKEKRVQQWRHIKRIIKRGFRVYKC